MTTNATCARCGQAMTVVPLGQASAYACHPCGGVFLGHAHATQVRAGLDRAAAAAAERLSHAKPWVDPVRDPAALACPLCHGAMQAQWHQRVRIDQCLQHGVFFDAHEVAAIAPRDASWTEKPQHRSSVVETALDLINQLF